MRVFFFNNKIQLTWSNAENENVIAEKIVKTNLNATGK